MLIITLSDGLSLPTGDDFVSKVFPNIWAFLVQLLAFIIMSIIVIKFAYKPVKKFLAQRREYVEEHLSKAEEATKKAEDNVKETEKNLALSNRKALQIIEDAKKEAEKQKQEILLQAKVEANNKMIQAQQDIEKEKQKAVQEVHDDVVNLALEASKTLLTREVNSLDNQKLLNDFVDELTEEK